MSDFQIYYFVSKLGRKPVREFINNLQPREQAKIDFTLKLLKKYGNKIGMPYVRKILNTPLWELRVRSKKTTRLFYVVYLRKSFMVLHGFVKKTQKTPSKEIQMALRRLRAMNS